jgi:hypothetical protein
VGALTAGSLAIGFGNLRPATLETTSYMRSTTSLTTAATAWATADCAKSTVRAQPLRLFWRPF